MLFFKYKESCFIVWSEIIFQVKLILTNPIPPQGPGSSGELHHPRPHPRELRLRRPLQPRGGRGLAREGDQPQPAAHAGPAAGHLGGAAQAGPGIYIPIVKNTCRTIGGLNYLLSAGWAGLSEAHLKSTPAFDT